MTVKQVEEFFKDKKDAKCEQTERIIESGHSQKSGGYIEIARTVNNVVPKFPTQPSQWWHLMNYCLIKQEIGATEFPRIYCKELLIWMAEVSGAVDKETLTKWVDDIINSNKWDSKVCYDKINTFIESNC